MGRGRVVLRPGGVAAAALGGGDVMSGGRGWLKFEVGLDAGESEMEAGDVAGDERLWDKTAIIVGGCFVRKSAVMDATMVRYHSRSINRSFFRVPLRSLVVSVPAVNCRVGCRLFMQELKSSSSRFCTHTHTCIGCVQGDRRPSRVKRATPC